jgi:hypothetical protein
MTVRIIDPYAKKDFQGLSTDTKPAAGVPDGATFYEVDTKAAFRFHDGQWYAA